MGADGAGRHRRVDAKHDDATRHGTPDDARLLLPEKGSARPGSGYAGTILTTMEIRELPDDELMARAREWRLRALRGEKDARGIAHELEREVRQRTKLQSGNDDEPILEAQSASTTQEAPRPAWRFW